MKSLKKLLPFLEEAELEDLLGKVLASENYRYQDVELRNLLVFLDQSKVDELFIEELKKKHDVTMFLPFVNHETLKNIVELYCTNKLEYEIDVSKFAPFLDADDIKLLYRHFNN